MILVDTSVWIDHLRDADAKLIYLLEKNQVACHPVVIGEVALGSIKNRETIISALTDLPSVVIAEHQEVLDFIELHLLSGSGIGFSDVHLLASAMLTPNTRIWTRDKRLAAQAVRLRISQVDH
jgi:predicted nucleic acid-binding protein